MPSGLIATPRHESYTSGNVRGRPLAGSPARLDSCGNPLCGQSVSLRLKINLLVKQAIDTRPALQSGALAYLAATASVRPHILLPHSGALAYHPVLKHRRASCAWSDMFACRAEGAGGCVASNTQARMSLLQTGSGWDPVALRQIRRAERSYSRTMRNCARRRRTIRSPGYGRHVIELHCLGRVAESGMIHLLCAPGWDPVALRQIRRSECFVAAS